MIFLEVLEALKSKKVHQFLILRHEYKCKSQLFMQKALFSMIYRCLQVFYPYKLKPSLRTWPMAHLRLFGTFHLSFNLKENPVFLQV